jgi:hypothetical protein
MSLSPTSGISLGYETGTFTPALTFATPGDFSATYSVQYGSYQRVGNMVTVVIALSTSAFTHTTASGACSVTGLPYTSANVSGNEAVLACRWSGITKANYTDVYGQVGSNASTIGLRTSGSGQAAANVNAADMPTGGSIILRLTGTYFV